jgi:hypothetical protein
MRRLVTSAVPCLLGAVAAHAMTGVLVHVGPFADPSGVHRVHGPLAVVACTAVVLGAVRRLGVGRPMVRSLDVVMRAAVVTAYLLGEAYLAQGLGSHLLHDPWVLLAPAGVLLAHLLTRVLAVSLLRVLPEPAETAGRLAPALDEMRFAVVHSAAMSSWWCAAVRGRAPPQLAHA